MKLVVRGEGLPEGPKKKNPYKYKNVRNSEKIL